MIMSEANAEWPGLENYSNDSVEVASEKAAEAPKVEEAKAEEVSEEVAETEETAAETEETSEEESEEEKPKKTPKDHQIERLKREKAEAKRDKAALEERLAALEARLTPKEESANAVIEDAAPDPSDAAKYPYGTLDPAYIKDLAAHTVRSEQAKFAQETALQREQEKQQQAALEKLDKIVQSGTKQFDDFQDVVESGQKGEWLLGQATFEAASESDHGAQILYELAKNPDEAERVAHLSPYGQMQYVAKREVEIASKAKPRVIPGAGEPPKTTTKGANSKVKGNPATDDWAEFGRLFDGK